MQPYDPNPHDASANTAASEHGRTRHGVTLRINGQTHSVEVEPWVSLLDLLRDRLDLTGTKKGCDHGQCGACTVMCDGERINSCLTLAVMRDSCEITTVEGLSNDGQLSELQQAFIDHDAFQCGYCTPGQLCSAAGLLKEGRASSVDEVRELMSGNLCRCGAYPQITSAVCSVALPASTRAAGSSTWNAPVLVGKVPA